MQELANVFLLQKLRWFFNSVKTLDLSEIVILWDGPLYLYKVKAHFKTDSTLHIIVLMNIASPVKILWCDTKSRR